MSDDIVTRLAMFSLDDGTDALNKVLTEAVAEIERLRNQHFTASRCNTCHHPLQPELIEVTLFDDELPRWTVGWSCTNTYLHKRINQRQQKDNTDD